MNEIKKIIAAILTIMLVMVLSPLNGKNVGSAAITTVPWAVQPLYSNVGTFAGELAPVVDKNSKPGFVDHTGKLVVSFNQYDYVYNFSDGLARVIKGGQFGFIDEKGKPVIPCSYDIANDFTNGLAQVMKNGKWGVADKTGKLVIPCIYDDLWKFYNGLACVSKDNRYGFVDTSGKLVIPCIYEDSFTQFENGLVRVLKDGNYGYVSKNGILYEAIGTFSEGLTAVYKDGKAGYVDANGLQVIECKFDDVSPFWKGKAVVNQNYEYSIIDLNGQVTGTINQERLQSLSTFSEGLIGHYENGKWGYLDLSGNLVVPCMYDFVDSFKNGLGLVEKDGKYGFVNTAGDLVISCDNDSVNANLQGMVVIGKDGKEGGYDLNGKLIVPFNYSSLFPVENGLISASKDGKSGYINLSGIWYDNRKDASEGLTPVSKNDKWGYADAKGKLVVPCIYDAVRPFRNGLAGVSGKGKWGFIDKTGKAVIPSVFDQVKDFSNDLAAVSLGQSWGFINRQFTGKAFQLAPVTTDQKPGTFTYTQNVYLESPDPETKIYYTTNGSMPTTASTVYTGCIQVSRTTTIKAIAVRPGMVNSPVASFSYTIKKK